MTDRTPGRDAEYVRTEDAARLLDEAERAGAAVLGIDAFARDGDSIVPLMDHILDLSTANDPARSVEDARRFVAGLPAAATLLDIVIETP